MRLWEHVLRVDEDQIDLATAGWDRLRARGCHPTWHGFKFKAKCPGHIPWRGAHQQCYRTNTLVFRSVVQRLKKKGTRPVYTMTPQLADGAFRNLISCLVPVIHPPPPGFQSLSTDRLRGELLTQ